MSETPALTFNQSSRLGKVVSVDTSRVLIAVEDAVLLPRAAVGSLVAIQGTTAQEFLIGMTERVTRQLSEQTAPPDPMQPTTLAVEVVPDDVLRAVLVGTYRSIEGAVRNRFKRGADSFPQIDRDCFLVEGNNLQRFMSLLGAELEEKQRLELGHFVIDKSAVAIANGDRFFQRHAAILGSTGSGKSCAVSLILERASARKYANLVVFDMHGEYASLANPPAPEGQSAPLAIADAYKIAGPGDLDAPSDNTLFLPYWLLNREEMLSMILDRSDQNAPNQASRFTLHVRELKEQVLVREKKEDIKATFTVDSPIPYDLSGLIQKLKNDDTKKGIGKTGNLVKGEWEGRLTRFLSRLEAKAEDRRYGFMFNPPGAALEYDWLAMQTKKLLAPGEGKHGIKVVDFSEVPADVLPVVAGVFARLLYDVQFWMQPEKRTPFRIRVRRSASLLACAFGCSCSRETSPLLVRTHCQRRQKIWCLSAGREPASIGRESHHFEPMQQLPYSTPDKRSRSERCPSPYARLLCWCPRRITPS